MNYLFTSAVKGSEFIQEGIKPPKPLIRVFGNELLIWSMNSFRFKDNDKIFIITLKAHKVKENLELKIKKLYPQISIYWLELDSILHGQLITIMEGISYFNIEGSLVIHNCDTFHTFDIEKISIFLNQENFVVIPCFYAVGDSRSIEKNLKGNLNTAYELKEKIRISSNCSVGTYIFKSALKFMSLAKEYLQNQREKEFYISSIYQFALEKNLKVKITNAKSVKIFRTPKQLLNSFNISFYELLGENAWDAHQIKTLIVDIDQTICQKNLNNDYTKAIAIKNVCQALRRANELGFYIILFTSRNMRTFKGSIGLINKFTAPILIKWLNDNNIPFDELYFGKPWGNSVSYIDDKNLLIESFIKNY